MLLACAAGLAAGVFFGRTERGEKSQPTHVSPTKPGASSAAAGEVKSRAPSFAAHDPRIVRLFSALQEPVVLRQRFELFAALRDLTASDMPALVKHIESLPANTTMELRPALIERWFELDFAAARDWMRAHPREFSSVKAWAKANPRAAIQEALAGTEGNRASMLLNEAVKQLAGPDAAAQVTEIKALPSGKLRDILLQNALGEWAKTDPRSAWAAVAEMRSGSPRDVARQAVLRAWASSDPAAALGQLGELLPTLQAGVLGNELVTAIAGTIGKKDPRLVLDWLGEIPAEFRVAPAIAAAREWAAKEPAAALDWCVENGVDVARGKRDGFNMWQAGVLGEALSAQPEATIEWLEARPAGPDRDRLLERALADGLWRVPKEQLFAEGSAFAMRLFGQLAEESQARTADDLGKKRAEQGDLADLGAWAGNFAAGPARANAVAGAIGAAYARDASGVEALLATTSTSADRDAALRGLAETMSSAAPADAAGRALAIGDAAVRRETLGAVVTAWQKRDAEAAGAWLREAAGIPEAWKQAWRVKLGSGERR